METLPSDNTKYKYELVESIEPIIGSNDAEDKEFIKKTWRTIRLLRGNISIEQSFENFCEEIVIDETNDLRICGERLVEKCLADKYELLPLIQSLHELWGKIPGVEYIQREIACLNPICAELNKPSLLRVKNDLDALLKLPSPIINNSINRDLILYLTNLLYLFREWYDDAKIDFPIDLQKIDSAKIVDAYKATPLEIIKEKEVVEQHIDLHDQNKDAESAESKKELEKLKNTYEVLGFEALTSTKPLEKERLMVMSYLRDKHGNIKVSSRTLYTLSDKIKTEARDWLMEKLGNNPKSVDICKNVFKMHRKKARRNEDEYSVGYSD